jgi:uncharacterized protein HemX
MAAMNPPTVFKLPGSAAQQSDPITVPHDDRAEAPAVRPKSPRVPAAPDRHAFVPVMLLALALAVWFGAQLFDAYQQRLNLLTTHASQQQTVDNAGKLRQSLDALAADTQRMADGGNANAALLVTELRKRGITISVPGAATAAPLKR